MGGKKVWRKLFRMEDLRKTFNEKFYKNAFKNNRLISREDLYNVKWHLISKIEGNEIHRISEALKKRISRLKCTIFDFLGDECVVVPAEVKVSDVSQFLS